MPVSIIDPCRNIDDFRPVRQRMYQLQAAFIQLQRYVFLPRVACVQAKQDSLEDEIIKLIASEASGEVTQNCNNCKSLMHGRSLGEMA